MSQWNTFPLPGDRPADAFVFSEESRPELELTVAVHVANLLRDYGDVDALDVDSDNPETESCERFYGISIEPVFLEDDVVMLVEQFPVEDDGVNTSPGAHSVSTVDEEANPIFSATVWDPNLEVDKRVHAPDGQPVAIEILQELYEALRVISERTRSERAPQTVLELKTYEYPINVDDLKVQYVDDDENLHPYCERSWSQSETHRRPLGW